MRLAGVDGCKGGWVAVVAEADNLAAAKLAFSPSFGGLLTDIGAALAVVDMPIGFVSGPDGRDVETAMRGFLKGKASLVFNTPCREALNELTYWDASAINQFRLGKSLTKQTFALFPKMKEVDAIVRLVGQDKVREGHPEASFAAMNGAPVLSKKREPSGVSERIAILERERIRASLLLASRLRLPCADDDILDAAALLWSATRYSTGSHIMLPPTPLRDSLGIEMSIVA